MEVDVRNTSGQVVDHVEVSDLLFNAPIYEALVHQALVAATRKRPAGNTLDEDSWRVTRRRTQAVAAEVHGPRATGQHPLPVVASWRRRVRTQATQLSTGYSGSHETAGASQRPHKQAGRG